MILYFLQACLTKGVKTVQNFGPIERAQADGALGTGGKYGPVAQRARTEAGRGGGRCTRGPLDRAILDAVHAVDSTIADAVRTVRDGVAGEGDVRPDSGFNAALVAAAAAANAAEAVDGRGG